MWNFFVLAPVHKHLYPLHNSQISVTHAMEMGNAIKAKAATAKTVRDSKTAACLGPSAAQHKAFVSAWKGLSITVWQRHVKVVMEIMSAILVSLAFVGIVLERKMDVKKERYACRRQLQPRQMCERQQHAVACLARQHAQPATTTRFVKLVKAVVVQIVIVSRMAALQTLSVTFTAKNVNHVTATESVMQMKAVTVAIVATGRMAAH